MMNTSYMNIQTELTPNSMYWLYGGLASVGVLTDLISCGTCLRYSIASSKHSWRQFFPNYMSRFPTYLHVFASGCT